MFYDAGCYGRVELGHLPDAVQQFPKRVDCIQFHPTHQSVCGAVLMIVIIHQAGDYRAPAEIRQTRARPR